MRLTDRSFKGRLVVPFVLGPILLGSCGGGNDDPEAAFCSDARDFIDYHSGLGIAVFVPEETEAFFAGSVERITDLALDAPPTVAADVDVVRDAFVRLDANLAAVGYDVTALTDAQLDTSESDDASDAIDEFLASACRREGDPFSGFADDPFAPLVLSPAEIDELDERVEGQDAELEQLVATQLVDAFGITGSQATCLVDGLGMSFIASFTGGGAVTEADSERFLVQLETCGVPVESIVGS